MSKRIQKALESKGYKMLDYNRSKKSGYITMSFDSPIELPDFTDEQERILKKNLSGFHKKSNKYFDFCGDFIHSYSIKNMLEIISFLPTLHTYDE